MCKGEHPSSLKIDLEILNRLQKRKAVSGKLMYIICHVKIFACAGGVIICMLLVDFILSSYQHMPNVFWTAEAEFMPVLRHQADMCFLL